MPRRDMSYRKPAPIYVPSPPTSPAMGHICPSFKMANEKDQVYQVVVHLFFCVPRLYLSFFSFSLRGG